MAQKVLVQLVDDLDGTQSDDIETIRFALDGVGYEIDLTEANAEKLRDALAEYQAHARRVGGRKSTGGKRVGGKSDPKQTQAMREWARVNGWPELGDRGRIPREVQEAFQKAGGRTLQAVPDPEPATPAAEDAPPAKTTKRKPPAKRTVAARKSTRSRSTAAAK